MTTTNFADFGWRERKMAAELLVASCEQGFPDNFEDDEVQIMMNQNSGNVFFTNSEYQVCMMNGTDLEMFYTTPYHGHEGFADELQYQYEKEKGSWNQMDIDFLIDNGIIEQEDEEEMDEVC